MLLKKVSEVWNIVEILFCWFCVIIIKLLELLVKVVLVYF